MIIAYSIFIILGAMILGFTLKERQVPLFTDDNCIRAIVGEYAREDDYYGTKLMAHAIRNRKTLRGVYGFYARHSDHESKKVWENASLAWFDSLNEFDPLHGATEWRSIDDVRKHGHPKHFVLVEICNGTFYYKPLK